MRGEIFILAVFVLPILFWESCSCSQGYNYHSEYFRQADKAPDSRHDDKVHGTRRGYYGQWQYRTGNGAWVNYYKNDPKQKPEWNSGQGIFRGAFEDYDFEDWVEACVWLGIVFGLMFNVVSAFKVKGDRRWRDVTVKEYISCIPLTFVHFMCLLAILTFGRPYHFVLWIVRVPIYYIGKTIYKDYKKEMQEEAKPMRKVKGGKKC